MYVYCESVCLYICVSVYVCVYACWDGRQGGTESNDKEIRFILNLAGIHSENDMFKPILEKSLEGRIPSAENSGGHALQYRVHLQGRVSPCKELTVGELGSWVNRGW